MKKILLVIVLILSFATHLFAQNEIKKTYYDTGELESETPYKNNQKHGVAKIYYKNGAVKSEIPYKNNQIDGNAKKYYEKGVLEIEASFRNGKVKDFTKSLTKKVAYILKLQIKMMKQ